ncbi:MAG: Aminomethyltransferase, mitochondrial [Trizodia sp. TS-e1964]|nr:MAG: Aminomethyltransferase, mitochondrial [Trizodia sp. TS-e1964]
MVPFAGYTMPVQYADLSVGESHRWTRERSSLFDVSHMVQHKLSGPGATALLLKMTPSSISTLGTHHSTLSCFLHPGSGGIVDDTVITRFAPELFYFVTNAACRERDLEYLAENIQDHKRKGGQPVEWQVLNDWGLIALQGPSSEGVLQEILDDESASSLETLYFGQSRFFQVQLDGNEHNILVSRGGYTGEDGFEISLPPNLAVPFTLKLIASSNSSQLRWAGLGARDSLRIEAGMCLYGHDLDDTTTPVEGGLAWIIGKDRRTEGGFHGAEAILPQLQALKEGKPGLDRRRVGLIVDGAPAREGAEILNDSGDKIGTVTSGCPSPTLSKNIAMGYVPSGWHKLGTEVGVLVRGKRRSAVVAKMPFVPTKYWKKGGARLG